MPALPAFPRFPKHGLLMCLLVVATMTGWGATFYALSVLARDIQRDLGLDPRVVFGGITVLLLTSAALAPTMGRHFDRAGTRVSMCAGAVVCALGLASLSLAQGPASYLASWFVIGVGHAFALTTAGNVTIVQLMGARARRVIGLMMLATALSSSIAWPLVALLSENLGWRATWLVLAALQILISLPIYASIPRGLAQAGGPRAPAGAPGDSEAGRLAPDQRRKGFWLVAIIFSASGLVSWGLPLHLIDILRHAGLDQAGAVLVATLSGPATLLARLTDATLGQRISVERAALVGMALGPLACLIMVLVPGSPAAAVAFVLLFSAAMGVIAVARATLPLALFGRSGFGSLLGRLTVPLNFAFAAAPLFFAVMIEWLGRPATLAAAAAIQLVALAAMLALLRLLARR
ncbi:hypothetical protein ASE63_07840 [Bosea sp. Root381]|uniref:MFS transporter n=1 Tax=Bosea sp. Root381 TaxID=1736524 RepID=UPI0006F4BD05|nr:MFS transporter [Bosea sp. Root381]KRE02263.1 hypothetical protein ASE63_07840 [Bosea sp. Root381]